MSNLFEAAQQFINQVVQNKSDGNLQNTPWKQSALNAITSGDQKRTEELARNIMKSYGFSSPEEAVQVGLKNLSQNKR